MKDYKDWVVWQRSMSLVEEIYIITKKFPRAELYGLTSQMTRSAVSIPSNIAEGYGRLSRPDQHNFYRIAFASARELDTQLEIAVRVGYLSKEIARKSQGLLLEVIKLLSKMIFPSRS